MNISEDRTAARIVGVLALAWPALALVVMAVDGRVEWELQRDNPVGNTVSLITMAALTVCGVLLLLFPRIKGAVWQTKMAGACLLLIALEKLSSLFEAGFLNGPVNAAYVFVLVGTLALTAFFAYLGIASFRGRKLDESDNPTT